MNILDQKLMKLRHDDIESVKEQAVKLRETATSVEEVIKVLKVYLATLRNIITEVSARQPNDNFKRT